MTVKNYQDLIGWQKAMDLVEVVYHLTKRFPSEELYGLTSQIRRAAVSVPSNIAEGQGRSSPNDFARFLSIAHGSLREVETQILIAVRLKYLQESDAAQAMQLCGETGRILNGLMNKLRSRQDADDREQ
jgi:four helix bundle protein